MPAKSRRGGGLIMKVATDMFKFSVGSWDPSHYSMTWLSQLCWRLSPGNGNQCCIVWVWTPNSGWCSRYYLLTSKHSVQTVRATSSNLTAHKNSTSVIILCFYANTRQMNTTFCQTWSDGPRSAYSEHAKNTRCFGTAIVYFKDSGVTT